MVCGVLGRAGQETEPEEPLTGSRKCISANDFVALRRTPMRAPESNQGGQLGSDERDQVLRRPSCLLRIALDWRNPAKHRIRSLRAGGAVGLGGIVKSKGENRPGRVGGLNRWARVSSSLAELAIFGDELSPIDSSVLSPARRASSSKKQP